jgi:hypothetical protein
MLKILILEKRWIYKIKNPKNIKKLIFQNLETSKTIEATNFEYQ